MENIDIKLSCISILPCYLQQYEVAMKLQRKGKRKKKNSNYVETKVEEAN